MTKDETKELIAKAMERIALMQAYVDGKQIQFFNRLGDKWEDTIDPRWSQDNLYRVKPEPKYRPFANFEECWQEMQKHQPFGWIKDTEDGTYIMVTNVDVDELSIDGNPDWGFDGVMRIFTFADGTPFGIKENF